MSTSLSETASIIEAIWNCVPGDREETGKAADAANETNKRLSSEVNYEGVYAM